MTSATNSREFVIRTNQRVTDELIDEIGTMLVERKPDVKGFVGVPVHAFEFRLIVWGDIVDE